MKMLQYHKVDKLEKTNKKQGKAAGMNDEFYSGGIDWGAVDIALPESEPNKTQQQVNQIPPQDNNYNNNNNGHRWQQQEVPQQQQQQQKIAHDANNNNENENQPSEPIVMSSAEFHLQQKVNSSARNLSFSNL